MATPLAKWDVTLTFQVPSPDPSQAKEARVVVDQAGHPAHTAVVALLSGGRPCKPAPVIGLSCSVHLTLANDDFTYAVSLLDEHGKLRFERRATVPRGESGFLSFVLTNKWTTADVVFANPTMGQPSHTPLLVTAFYKDTAQQLGGIVIGSQPFDKPIALIDTDKSGATKVSPATMTSPGGRADLYYDGKSFVNPYIVAKGQLNARIRLIPTLRVHEYEVPSHTLTANRAGVGRLLLNNGSITFLEDGAVGRIDSKGLIQETKLPAYEYDIANGPDGYVWTLVVDGTGEALARLNGDGSLTQYPLPDWNFGPMTLGPDGNFWMPASSTTYQSIIRRVSPTGTATDFPMPGNEGGLSDVIAGGDGNLWFLGTAQQSTGEPPIGVFVKVQTDGTHFQYWLPGANGTCCQAGPADPVWVNGKLYAAIANAHLGQLDETGTLRKFSPDLQMETPSASPPVKPPMAIGPDGALWYAANVHTGDCSLGHVTLTGVVTFVHFASSCTSSYSPNVLPTAFVAGPNNTLWYTRGDRVGKISL